MFDQSAFLRDLATFVGFKSCVAYEDHQCFVARQWIKDFFRDEAFEIIDLEYGMMTSLLVKPRNSSRPNVLGDGHIEVVPGGAEQFSLTERDGWLYGRGVADMKTQTLMMMHVFRELVEQGDHRDFWILFSEDEETGSADGVKKVVRYLWENDLAPNIVFVPDGGPNFAYVEKEKGLLRFTVTMPGKAAHASRPFLGVNAVDTMLELYEKLRRPFANPASESDWVNSLVLTGITAGTAVNQIPAECRAQFDLRFTEIDTPDAMLRMILNIVEEFGVSIHFETADPAAFYPRERPVAAQFIELLRTVSGHEPEIIHSTGASNGRFYIDRQPDIYVLMSNPTVRGAHAENESVEVDSLLPYYHLVHKTAQLHL